MADCGKYDDMISALIDGELTDYEIRELKEHARNCRSCAELLKLYSAMSSVMSDLAETPPNDLSQNIMGQIRYDRKKSRKGRGLRRLTAVAAVLIVVISGIWLLNQALPFSGSSDNSSVADSAVMEAASVISPEESTASAEDVQVPEYPDVSKSSSASSYDDAGLAESVEEYSGSDDSDRTLGILGEENSAIEVLLTDENGNEIAKQVEANSLDELFTYSGVSNEPVTGEPVCKVRITVDGVEHIYSVWISNGSVLIQGSDGILNISVITQESFEKLILLN